VKVAADAGFVSLVVTYRNDGEGPTVGSGRSTLGAAEADGVRAAVRYAIAHGADRVVLFRMVDGRGIALQVAADVEFDGVIDRLVLDSPVIDWCATIAANCARVGLPPQAAALARPWLQWSPLARSVGLPSALPLGRFNWIDRATALPVHALILHGTDDTSAPPLPPADLRNSVPTWSSWRRSALITPWAGTQLGRAGIVMFETGLWGTRRHFLTSRSSSERNLPRPEMHGPAARRAATRSHVLTRDSAG
jgi:hypothetical protein